MNDALVKEIQKLNKLLVLFITKGQTQTETILILNKVGFGQTEIATLVGTTTNTVNTTLNRAKKKNKI